MDEGYIKYKQHYHRGNPIPQQTLKAVEQIRQQLYQQNLIGYNPTQQVGYGNISQRCKNKEEGKFIITGTQTGHLPQLTNQHYSTVTQYSIPLNELWCHGPCQASSEALTHAAIYELNKNIQAVIHVHSAKLWQQYLHHLPTTVNSAAYGTPDMAYAIKILYKHTDLPQKKVLIMGGHTDGIISFGNSLEQAYQALETIIN